MSVEKKKKTGKPQPTVRKKNSLKGIKEHTFCGNKYKIAWEKPPQNSNYKKNKQSQVTGLCDPPSEPEKTIIIDPTIGEKELLKTALDEAIHACCWPLDNDYVDEMSESMGEFLWRMGFRRK